MPDITGGERIQNPVQFSLFVWNTKLSVFQARYL